MYIKDAIKLLLISSPLILGSSELLEKSFLSK